MFYFSFKYRQLTSRDDCLSYHGNSFKINYFIYVLASPVLHCCVCGLSLVVVRGLPIGRFLLAQGTDSRACGFQ